MNIILPLIIVLTPVSSLCLGSFFIIKPALIIEMQRKFYARINWRIEPISMQKEVRNTRIMGFFLIILAFLAIIYIVIRGILFRG